MRRCMITFRSVTPAQRGEEALHKAGIECYVQRTPRSMESAGCGYGLGLHCVDILPAVEQLRKNGIAYRKVYQYGAQGEAEEMDL